MDSTGANSGARAKSRRRFIAGSAATAAAAVAGVAVSGSKADAAAFDELVLGVANDAGSNETTLTAMRAAGPALVVTNTDPGSGGRGLNINATGMGVSALVTGSGPGSVGLEGASIAGPWGSGGFPLGSGTGVSGWTNSGIAVSGISRETQYAPAPNVGTGIGVFGRSGSGIGVKGQANVGGGIGVQAVGAGPGTTALEVIGRAEFASVGNGVIPDKAKSVTVVNPFVSAASHVMATLTSDPGPDGATISWLDITSGQFVIYLTKKVKDPTSFRYLVVDPA